MQCKTDSTTGRTVYRCHNDFGALDWRELKNMVPKIADFGLGTRLDNEYQEGKAGRREVGIHPIQPDHYRAPEVILGCGWDFSADIWNFGVMVRDVSSGSFGCSKNTESSPYKIQLCKTNLFYLLQVWNIIERANLFCQVHDGQGQYDAKSHLAEMIALLGPPPEELLAKSDAIAEYKWPNSIQNETGKLCCNLRDFFDGPFFNEKGRSALWNECPVFADFFAVAGEFLHENLIPTRKLEDTIPSLEEKERHAFLSFVRDMLTWCPEERKTARELIDHPFLKIGNR